MLGRGDLSETRYVFGKIVLDTMSSGIVADGEDYEAERCKHKTEGTKEIDQLQLSDPVNHQLVARKHKRQVLSPPNPGRKQGKIKKQKMVANEHAPGQKVDMGNHELFAEFEYKETSEECPKRVKLSQKVDLSTTKDSVPKKKNRQRKQLINDRRKTTIVSKSSLDQARHLKMVEHNSPTSSEATVSKNHQKVADNCYINVDAKTTNNSDLKKEKLHSSPDEVLKEKERQQLHKCKKSQPPLSSLFK